SSPGSISIVDNAGSSPQILTLLGTGVSPAVTLSPTTVNFGNQVINSSSAPQTIILTNTGNSSLSISSITSSADYTVTNNNCPFILFKQVLPAGAKCTFDLVFTPTKLGTDNGTVTIVDDAPTSPQTVTLNGIGVAPGANLSTSSVTFGNQIINTTSAAQTVTLTNSGTSP